MRGKYRPHHILQVVLLFIALAGFSASNSKANENSKYLDAVGEFADNVLKYGRDTYGPKHTPLFVDGLNIHTHEPVKWISPEGERWILSNFASQQTLLRTLDGLSNITGDARYRNAAMDAIRYAFDNVRTPSGLFYWGHITAYDALGDTPRGNTSRESIKLHYPYYELMWEVDPEATKRLIEALWCAHVMDWSNLDFNRTGITTANLEEPWNHEYKGGTTFFKSKYGGGGFSITGSSLVHAGTTLYRLSRQGQPLVWSKRLAKRFIDTRHAKTGIAHGLYNNPKSPLGDDLKEHFADPHTRVFPWQPFEEMRYRYYPENTEAHAWISFLLVGGMLGEKGREFTQWALEELTAWGKAAYRKKDNSFIPILTDGTRIEGYVSKRSNTYGPKGAVAKSLFVDLSFFWGYAVAYRATGDKFMWQMVRDIALGNDFGDVGQTSAHTAELQSNTTCSHAYAVFGFLELYAKTKNPAYLKMAQRIGDNILLNQFYKGFFVPSKRHIYTRFDCFEPLALLHLHAAATSKTGSVPQVWPSCTLFKSPYRHKEVGIDRQIIYNLTESPEPPLSLQEAATIGDIELVRSLLDKGVGVNSWDTFKKTALLRAAISGHKNVVELLLAKGADIEAGKLHMGTALHYAAEKGHKEIAELLIAKGADVNAKNNKGQTPIDIALNQNHKDIGELLLEKGAELSIHVAAYLGDIDKVKSLIETGTSVNGEPRRGGRTPLYWAVKNKHKDVAKLLIDKGANVSSINLLYYACWYGYRDFVELFMQKGADANSKNWGESPSHYAVWGGHADILELLLAKGADANAKGTDAWSLLHYAAGSGSTDMTRLLLDKGADVNAKESKGGQTPLHRAVEKGHITVAKLLIANSADVNAKDNQGRTPLSLAKEKGHKEIVELLRKPR